MFTLRTALYLLQKGPVFREGESCADEGTGTR